MIKSEKRSSRPTLTKGPEGPLLGHQGEETGLQGVCDDDVKQLLEVLPATARESTASASDRGAWPPWEGQWTWTASKSTPVAQAQIAEQKLSGLHR